MLFPLAMLLSARPSLSWLRILDRGTGDCIKTALEPFSGVADSSSNFQLKVRTATTDQHPSNYLCESLTMQDRGRDWSSVRLTCNVHCVARMFTRTLGFLDDHLTGLINMSLFLSQGSRMFLSVLANGDWTRRDRFEVWVLPGVQLDELVVKKTIVKGLLTALTGRVFRTYPRHRWLGCDVAVDEIALLEAVHDHRLASDAFAHMCGVSPPQGSGDPLQFPQQAAASSVAAGHDGGWDEDVSRAEPEVPSRVQPDLAKQSLQLRPQPQSRAPAMRRTWQQETLQP